ncbi:hypothetical protein [Actinokineospora bangkokensis]|uniref:Uncharacterized protein n=1 Tax=Actinokineospora bangkokensis TaxID=1193682 RepID=A0A1Q9LF99_9PSEU|nr:hypothetical protein [Actinokineospora bangkokensis]OLR90712.1 hypothetical protein BJP25_29390 [Actinokineospora bangkokensis]
MVMLVLTCGVATLLSLAIAAGFTAVFSRSEKKSRRAQRVLRLVLSALVGSTGLLAALVVLADSGWG